MLFILLSLAVLDPPKPPTAQGPPIAWSPDSRWLAHVQVVRPAGVGFEPGWLLGEATETPRPEGVKSYRIWASKPETGESVKLAESAEPLSSPCWHPDGTAVAYERVVVEAPGRSRRELVVQNGPEAQRVLWTRPSEGGLRDPATGLLPLVAPAWSVDGRHLAVPDPGSPSIAIIRVADGKLVKTIDGGFAPSWSEDGKLAYFRGDGLFWTDSHFATARRIADVPEAGNGPAPSWSRDGLSILFVRRGQAARRPPFVALAPNPPVDPAVFLVRQRIDTLLVEATDPILHDPASSMADVRGISIALGREFGEVYSAIEVRGVPSQFLTFRLRPGQDIEINARANPVDFALPVGVLSSSTASRRLALRIGPPGLWGVPGVCDPNGAAFSPIVVDDRARVEWVASLVGLAHKLLGAGRKPGDRPERRPTLIPLPGVLVADDSLAGRLRHVAAIGRPLCDRPSDPSADPATRAFLAEARLFFDLLLCDYPSALADFPAYAPTATTPDRRARLLGLRAQIDLGLGNVDRARSAIDYLRATSAGAAQRIEETGAGVVLTPLPGPIAWIDGLSEALPGRSPSRADRPADSTPEMPNPPPSRSIPVRSTTPPLVNPGERDLPIIAPEPMILEPPPPPIRPF